MMTDCKIFIDATSYIANWISKQPSVGEESLTDWLLFEISSKSPTIHSISFSRHAEARKTGADWEWWFLYPHGSYKYRIQAKKVSPKGDNYASIAYTNKYGLQIEKLIADSKSANAIPVYVFFSASNSSAGSMCAADIPAKGAFSAGAQEIYSKYIENGKIAVSESDILKISIPLHCFTCCPLSDKSDAQSMDLFIAHYFSEEKAIFSAEKSTATRPGFHENVPSYISSLLEHAENVPEWWLEEYRTQLDDFDGLLINDFRERT